MCSVVVTVQGNQGGQAQMWRVGREESQIASIDSDVKTMHNNDNNIYQQSLNEDLGRFEQF